MPETPQQRYSKKYMKNVALPINTKTEQDIIEKLNSVPNKSGYIKQLIRADIAKEAKKQARQATKPEN